MYGNSLDKNGKYSVWYYKSVIHKLISKATAQYSQTNQFFLHTIFDSNSLLNKIVRLYRILPYYY